MSFYVEGYVRQVWDEKSIVVQLEIDNPDQFRRFRFEDPFDSPEEAREHFPFNCKVAINADEIRWEYYYIAARVEFLRVIEPVSNSEEVV